jgi:ABC-type proline/glycine betaine transport system ATPase subunit
MFDKSHRAGLESLRQINSRPPPMLAARQRQRVGYAWQVRADRQILAVDEPSSATERIWSSVVEDQSP